MGELLLDGRWAIVVLSKGGLGPALKTLARRSAVPVELSLGVHERLPESAEVAAYYVVTEALTNTAKHAQASTVDVRVDADDANFHLSIEDDGIGGADVGKGSGLTALLTASRRSAARWTSPAASDVARLCASPSLSNPRDHRPNPEGESGLRAGHQGR